MRVIGTAGHVDHGKSTLIEALTGTHPDRLKEERDRQMTIDLGFAWMALPDGEEIGIVDVPGHRDFIENMLAGVGGIDAALFVIAADEGIMPQTREHLAILNLLKVPAALTVITKIDLVQDDDWLELVKEEVERFSKGTILENAPILFVSAKTGAGLDELKLAMVKMLAALPPRQTKGIARLPIDRVFTIAGFGTVVTGTLIDGTLKTGQEVQIYPGELTAKIRGLQTHKQKEETAQPGSRTAINLAGVDVRLVKRGDVLSLPQKLTATRRFDARLEMLKDASAALAHHSEVKVFAGTSEVLAFARVLAEENIEPGKEGWIQLELQAPLTVLKGDRFILRRPSPAETLGGGVVINPLPGKRHKRFDAEVIKNLETLLSGTPQENLLNFCLSHGPITVRELLQHIGGEMQQGQNMLDALLEQGQLCELEAGMAKDKRDALVVSQGWLNAMIGRVETELSDFHHQTPYRPGMPREELKQKSGLTARHFALLLKRWLAEDLIKENRSFLALPHFTVQFDVRQQKQMEALLEQFRNSPYAPPVVKDCQTALGNDLYRALLENEILIEVSAEVVFDPQAYAAMLTFVKEEGANPDGLTVAQFRDHFNTSRRYALAFLEYLDASGVTLRQGDVRKIKKANR